MPAFVVDVAELEGGFSVGTLQQAEVLTQEDCFEGSNCFTMNFCDIYIDGMKCFILYIDIKI